MKYALPLALALAPLFALGGCITYRTVNDGIARARIGETANVGGHAVLPKKLLEDSRCAQGTQCVWAGRVRIAAKVDGADAQLTLGETSAPVRLVEVYPAKTKDITLYPDEYRFGFTAP